MFGSANISFQTILHTLIGNVSTTDEMVIWNIRFPRNIVGALVGGNLAVSGAILQAVMKNPLADPGIVGVSSGAGLAGVIMLILCRKHLCCLLQWLLSVLCCPHVLYIHWRGKMGSGRHVLYWPA